MTSTKTAHIRNLMIGAACFLAAPAMGALAGSASMPASYDSKAENYIESRLSDARGAMIRQRGEPYRVTAKLKGDKDYECWAVDYDVRADLGRSTRGAGTYTVLFYNGKAVALESDLRRQVVRLNTEDLYAQN